MEVSIREHVSQLPASLADPLMLRVYEETFIQRQRWQAIIRQTIRRLLGLGEDEAFDPDTVLSAAEIRVQMSEHVPYEEKLSSLIVAMREE